MSSFCEKNVFDCTSCGARPQRSLKGRPPVVHGYDPRTIGRTETAGLGARGQVCSGELTTMHAKRQNAAAPNTAQRHALALASPANGVAVRPPRAVLPHAQPGYRSIDRRRRAERCPRSFVRFINIAHPEPMYKLWLPVRVQGMHEAHGLSQPSREIRDGERALALSPAGWATLVASHSEFLWPGRRGEATRGVARPPLDRRSAAARPPPPTRREARGSAREWRQPHSP